MILHRYHISCRTQLCLWPSKVIYRYLRDVRRHEGSGRGVVLLQRKFFFTFVLHYFFCCIYWLKNISYLLAYSFACIFISHSQMMIIGSACCSPVSLGTNFGRKMSGSTQANTLGRAHTDSMVQIQMQMCKFKNKYKYQLEVDMEPSARGSS